MLPNRLPTGVWPVMLTPFHEDGSIDWAALDTLTEWYLSAGAAGLFAVSGSSEVYELTHEERIALARRVIDRAAGRVPIVASAIDFGPLEHQAEFVRAIAETGVQAVVLATCQFAEPGEDDRTWLARAERLLALTADVPLGLYEIPTPYKRLLSPAQMRWAGETGRFLWFKDTCCRLDAITEKIEAVRGTPLRFYNANTPTLLGSLLAGGDGYSGIGANYCPFLYVWLCKHFHRQGEQAAQVQDLLTRFDPIAAVKYPAGAKLSLSRLGLPLRPVCRLAIPPLTQEQLAELDRFMMAALEAERELGSQRPV
jgi:4-hydroxy-tetrahydrodipicolinate synthase